IKIDRFSTEKIKWFGFSDYKYTEKKDYNQEYHTDQLVSSIRKHTEPEEKIKIGIFDFDPTLPYGLENLFWIKRQDRFIDALEFLAMFNLFIPAFDNFDFIVFCIPSYISSTWPASKWLTGEQIQRVLNSRNKANFEQIQLWDVRAWDDFLIKLDQEKENFELVETYNLEDKVINVCFIYKRKTFSS
ncbi:hypothetical protein ACFL3D_06905, partial [Candidatus Omnitrophota bacterium]